MPLLLLAACRQPSFPTYPEGYREFAYVANTAGNSVTVLDLVYVRPDRTLGVGVAPTAMAASPTRNEVYVLNTQPTQSAGSLSIIDTASNQVIATIPLHREPSSLSIDPTGHRAYVADTGSNLVSVVNLDTRRQIAAVPAGIRPDAILIAPDGRTLLVTSRTAGTVSLFTPSTLGQPLTLRSTFAACPGATSPVILPDSSRAFVACSAGHQILSLSLAAAPGSWPARQDPTLTADHLLALLDVGQTPTHLTLKPDGGELFVSNSASDSISEVSTQTDEVGSTYAIGNRPTYGVVGADNSALWVAASGADSISLYSIDDGQFLSSIHTGNSPGALAFSADQHLLLAADARSGDVSVIRTTSKLGPALLTILPAGGTPAAIAVKAMPPGK